MAYLKQSLAAWGTAGFEVTFKAELAGLDPDALRLQQVLRQGSIGNASQVGVMLLGSSETAEAIRVRVGLFFTSVIAGCNCADDPTPVDENPEYAELEIRIDRRTAETTITPVEA